MTKTDGSVAAARPQQPGTGVTVAIVTHERPDTLCTVVRDIWTGRRRPDEILVVCQGEGAVDTAHRLLREVPEAAPAVRFYASTRHGTNANWNDAVRLARGEFVAFTDDDMRLPEDWLEQMLDVWEKDWDRGEVLLTGPIHAPDGNSDPEATPGYRRGEERRVWRVPPRVSDMLYGGHFGAPRTVFARVEQPPFDERFGPGTRFPGAGDDEFAVRLVRAGVPVALDPSIQATHVASPGTWIGDQYRHSIGTGAMYVLRWSSGEPAVLRIVFRNLLTILVKVIRNLTRLRFREAAGRLAGVAGIVHGAWRWSVSGASEEPRAVEPQPDDLRLVTPGPEEDRHTVRALHG